ncbi:MAG TPA: MarR family transcriptional regulator [Nocardioidaceae bacterium]|nr:MarR family transcriptional regulator [Nocardioidaceae bacterium]
MATAPLPPDDAAVRMREVFDVLGPLYRRIFRTVENSEPIEGVSIGVRAVLDMLRANGPMTVPAMASTQALSRQFVQRMVNDAYDRDWVRLTDNPAHRRSSLVTLTASGERTIAAVLDREHAVLRDVPGDLTEDDIDTCLHVLRSLLTLVEDA